MTKKIAILFCFMISPAISLNFFKPPSNALSFLYRTRFVFDDRVYGLSLSSKKNTLPVQFAPNMHIGHEISLFGSLEFENWFVKQKNESDATPSEQISQIKFSKIAPGLFLRYAYQFPFSTNFGFFLGTTLGMVFTDKGNTQFQGGYGVFFPTILVGFTGNPIQDDRLTLAAEYGAIWYPEMVVYTNAGNSRPLAAALAAWNIYVENDYFVTNQTAISVSGGFRIINNVCSLSIVCSSTNYLYTLKIENLAYYGQVGVVFGLN